MLTSTQLNQVGNFDTATINNLNPSLGGGVDALSAAGACDLTKLVTELTVSGTKAYTLAAPTTAGDRKIVRCVAATSSPLGTLTVSSPDTTTGFACSATFLFDTVGQEIEFQATSGLLWRAVRIKRAGTSGTDGVVIGTTVINTKNMWMKYILSVTGTVSSTTTKALPNGSAVGERISISVSTAASIPSGTLGGVYVDQTGAARTGAVFDNVADTVMLEWDGSSWQSVLNSGVTWS